MEGDITTETDRLTAVESRLTAVESSLTVVETKLDGFIEETRSRFNSIEARMNAQFQGMIGMWVTTMLAVLAVLATILIKL